MVEAAPIIVAALFGDEDFAWLDGLRRQHFPPERNLVPAHLTLFHHLPPSIVHELRQRLASETSGVPAPKATISSLMSLGKGVAFRVESERLENIRNRLVDAFAGLLVPQDQAAWRAPVTVQNKVESEITKRLKIQLDAEFESRSLKIKGLASWFYRGGPWEQLSTHSFSG